MLLLKCCTQYVSKFERLRSSCRTGKGQFSFQCQRMFKLPENCTHFKCYQGYAQNPASQPLAACELRASRCESCSVVSYSLRPHGLQPTRLLCPGSSPGKNTEVGCHSLLQRIFPTHGLNQSLLHCRQILYHLSHQGSPLDTQAGFRKGR